MGTPETQSTAQHMVAIPEGTIDLRDDRIGRSWTVHIDGFLLAAHTVTQAQYRALTNASPSAFAGDFHPVDSVSWYDAVRFWDLLSAAEGLPEYYTLEGDQCVLNCAQPANGYRLPLDAEWEYACKAGARDPRYGEIDDIAWFEANSAGGSQEVGLKVPNAWGLHDMLGNVWEWCWDLYDPEVYGEYRVFRGGGWSDRARGCLATNRRRSHPTFCIDDLGFRVARSL